ncbi:unnamed protein product [Haemonchus placei]|uniref:Uncharacterized protein n=1 Tax=Haemonchus placei TaxID=6290 RepID=A0A0N4WAY2_HAEPC|nr:unnamed protein product [Haemonchus placei]
MAEEGKIISARREYVSEYYPDLLSNYSNSSGTISYETIITPRRPEQRDLRQATEATIPTQHPYYLREVELLPPPLIPEIVEWDLVKRINRLLLNKEKKKKTVEVHRADKGTVEQSKKVCPTELIRSPTTPLVTMEALEKTFNNDPYYISETELVHEQTELFKRRVQKRQQHHASAKRTRPNFPKDPPVPESRSYGPAAMSHDTGSDYSFSEDN